MADNTFQPSHWGQNRMGNTTTGKTEVKYEVAPVKAWVQDHGGEEALCSVLTPLHQVASSRTHLAPSVASGHLQSSY